MAKPKTDNLLKQAIADAKAVRATALANAKLALTEAFTPKLQSMLSSKLRNEMEGDFEEGDLNEPGLGKEVDPTLAREAKDVTGDSGSDPEAEKAGAIKGGGGQDLDLKHGSGVKTVYEAEGEIPGEEEEVPGEMGAEGDEEVVAEPGSEVAVEPGAEAEIAPEVGAEDGMEGGEGVPEEDDTELEEIIRELSAEGEEQVAEPFAGEESPEEEEQEKLAGGLPQEAKDVTAIASEDPEQGLAGDVGPESGSETAVESDPTVGQDTVGGEEGELDLENLVKEIEGEMGAEGDESAEEEKKEHEFDNLRKENVILRKSLKEHRSVVVYLRDRLNEINLLNAKLLYSNRIFRANSLTEGQKLRVIEAIDRANSIREAKLVYATLAESLKSRGTKLTEGKKVVPSASKVVASTKPSKTAVLTEGADLAARFRLLAGTSKKINRVL